MTNPNEMVNPIVAMWRQDRYRRTRELLDLVGAIQTGHFQLSSGLHSDRYVHHRQTNEAGRTMSKLVHAVEDVDEDRRPRRDCRQTLLIRRG